MITPRRTRLIRVSDLHAFRQTLIAAAPQLPSTGAIVVPTAGAAAQLSRLLPRQGTDGGSSPRIVTRDELYDALHERLPDPPRRLTAYEREALIRAAAREAVNEVDWPFDLSPRGDESRELRPGLVAEVLRFYDQLRRQGQHVARFEALLEETLARDADFDRGAERLLHQTRMLAATFRAYERRLAEAGACDEHALRQRLIEQAAATPVSAVIVTVADWIADRAGLWVADFDMLARIPGLEAFDVVVTESVLSSGFHQRIHDWLPGIEETTADLRAPSRPRLAVPVEAAERLWFTARDREEELIGVARRLNADGPDPRAAVVYKRPLPYLYLAREVFGRAGIPHHSSDTLPLAAEPFAAAVDLLLDFVASSFSRAALVALLRSPHLAWPADAAFTRASVSALDRALSEARYLGDRDRLSTLASEWSPASDLALPALRAAIAAADFLSPLQAAAPTSQQIDLVLSFLRLHEDPAPQDSRQRRARAAVVATLAGLAAASRAHDDAPLDVNGLGALVRRWIEEQTFAIDDDAPAADARLQLVDDEAAPYGDFDQITIVGLIDGEWPERPQRNIFYSASLLRSLGWPSEQDWRGAAEARFLDLLAAPSSQITLSTVTLDDEALVEVSPLVDEIPRARLSTVARAATPAGDLFVDEVLSREPVAVDALDPVSRRWAALRVARSGAAEPAFHGQAGAQPPRAWSVSALETYLDCPFKFYAQRILKLEEEPEDVEVMDPRRQGQLVHEVFEAFFKEWSASGRQAVTPENLADAREMFAAVVDRCLAGLSETEAALERTRLLGSSAAAGLGEAVLRMEAERSIGVVARLLEHRLEGEFAIDTESGPRTVRLNGKADRIDLLEDGTFRLIDYKLGWPPNKARALQLPIYSLCAEQRLDGHRGRRWTLGEAAYLAFKGPKRVVPLFSASDRERTLREAQQRLADAIDAIERGEFPPHPHDVYRCETCTFSAVCRTDYVGDV